MIRNDFRPRGHILENNGVDGAAELGVDHAHGFSMHEKAFLAAPDGRRAR